MTAAQSPAARWRQSQRARAATGSEREEPPGAEEDEAGHARLPGDGEARRRGRAAAGHVQSGRSSMSGGRSEGLGSSRSSSAAIAGEVVHVADAPGLAAAGGGDLAQGGDVDGVAGGGALLEVLGAERDGVDAHAVLGGEAGDLARVEAGGGVAAVGEQHDDARAGRARRGCASARGRGRRRWRWSGR